MGADTICTAVRSPVAKACAERRVQTVQEHYLECLARHLDGPSRIRQAPQPGRPHRSVDLEQPRLATWPGSTGAIHRREVLGGSFTSKSTPPECRPSRCRWSPATAGLGRRSGQGPKLPCARTGQRIGAHPGATRDNVGVSVVGSYARRRAVHDAQDARVPVEQPLHRARAQATARRCAAFASRRPAPAGAEAGSVSTCRDWRRAHEPTMTTTVLETPGLNSLYWP
jgi:hypothetical protein